MEPKWSLAITVEGTQDKVKGVELNSQPKDKNPREKTAESHVVKTVHGVQIQCSFPSQRVSKWNLMEHHGSAYPKECEVKVVL